MEDQNVKHRRERFQKQSSLLSKLTRQLSIHDDRGGGWSGISPSAGELVIYRYRYRCYYQVMYRGRISVSLRLPLYFF